MSQKKTKLKYLERRSFVRCFSEAVQSLLVDSSSSRLTLVEELDKISLVPYFYLRAPDHLNIERKLNICLLLKKLIKG